MADAKHCPAPWTTHPIDKSRGLPYVPVAAETLIARVYSKHFGDDAQALANARLIAAAPELLEALSIALELLKAVDPYPGQEDLLSECVEISSLVIAKATGSTT